MNCPESQRTFNDGYHIVHHLYPRLHWTELPTKFKLMLQEHKDNYGFNFNKIWFPSVAGMILQGRIEELVKDHYVHIDAVFVDKPDGDGSGSPRSCGGGVLRFVFQFGA